MKFTLLSFFLFLFLINSGSAQEKNTKSLEETIEKLRLAMLNGDRTELEMLSAGELTYGHSNGRMENQAEFVESLASGKDDFTHIELQNQTIDIVGKIGLVRHNLKGKTNTDGVIADVNIGVLLVWQQKGKNWKLLARQAFKL